jgi:20S proteasome alpha/beta subunit
MAQYSQQRDRTSSRAPRVRSTTVLCVRKDNKVVMAGDGQVTVGEHVMKHFGEEDPPAV